MSPAASSLDFYGCSSGDRGATAFPSSTFSSPPTSQQQATTSTNTTMSSGMPQERSVARPVANLGSTCYMNAVLQALAHAPELCLAMDCHPHRASCPKAAQSRSPVSGTRKSLRQASGRKSPPESSNATLELNADEFCTLCEVERHILQVHDSTSTAAASSMPSGSNSNSAANSNNTNILPVVPSTFVNGFIDHVAPWFQLGVQEDSHEFLRLLIDAMQKSCVQARSKKSKNNSNNETNPQGDDQSPVQDEEEEEDEDDPEYPFQLFRGSVESKVVCAHCKAISSTLDPIEDIGLEVTAPPGTALLYSSKSSTGRSASRNPSPTPAPALEDVQSAFRRFAREEPLDAQYKCEQCGKFGRATKQSRLARLPPILTLHLKRFRYGDRPATNTSTRRSARTSEVGQLLMTGDNGYSNDFYGSGGASFGGKTGSAKIEGHVKFGTVIDLKPYLTDALQKKGLNALCRLFAVIVHSGKNSHTGHYIAYVCNMSNKNEWWKMDDSRVTKVSEQEVLQAEAYMLFYRAMSHAVKTQLDSEMERRRLQQQQQVNNKRIRCFGPGELLDETGNSWDRRKASFPPHLIGLIEKVSEMMAEEVPLTRAALQEIEKEAVAAAGGKVRSSPRRHKLTKADVVGGTEKYRSVLMEIFYRLKDDPSAALLLASAAGGTSIAVESGSTSHITNENKQQQQAARVSVEEPVEDNTLL